VAAAALSFQQAIESLHNAESSHAASLATANASAARAMAAAPMAPPMNPLANPLGNQDLNALPGGSAPAAGERASVTHKFSIAGHEGYITVSLFQPDSRARSSSRWPRRVRRFPD